MIKPWRRVHIFHIFRTLHVLNVFHHMLNMLHVLSSKVGTNLKLNLACNSGLPLL